MLEKLAKGAKVSYPVLYGTTPMLESYKVVRLPTLILIGRDGRIIKRYGPKADKKAMVADIERTLSVQVSKEGEVAGAVGNS